MARKPTWLQSGKWLTRQELSIEDQSTVAPLTLDVEDDVKPVYDVTRKERQTFLVPFPNQSFNAGQVNLSFGTLAIADPLRLGKAYNAFTQSRGLRIWQPSFIHNVTGVPGGTNPVFNFAFTLVMGIDNGYDSSGGYLQLLWGRVATLRADRFDYFHDWPGPFYLDYYNLGYTEPAGLADPGNREEPARHRFVDLTILIDGITFADLGANSNFSSIIWPIEIIH